MRRVLSTMINIHDVYFDHGDEDDDVKKRVKCLVDFFVPTLCALSHLLPAAAAERCPHLSASKSVQSRIHINTCRDSITFFYTLRRSLAEQDTSQDILSIFDSSQVK